MKGRFSHRTVSWYMFSSPPVIGSGRRLSRPPELSGDVVFHDPHAVHLFQPLLGLLQKLMFSEMLDIFRVCQILQLGILVMVLFPMVNLVLILVVAVMTRARSHIWQCFALVHENDKFVACYIARAIRVQQRQDLPRNLGTALL